MMLIYTLIILFTLLLLYQAFLYQEFLAIFNFNSNNLIEGLENKTEDGEKASYQPYNVSDPNNALILAQQNAGNIEVLKGRIDGFDGIKEKVDNMKINIDSMQVQMDSLVQQQADYAQEMAGSEPVEVTGTDELTIEEVEDDIDKE